jgi:hypothetical protein
MCVRNSYSHLVTRPVANSREQPITGMSTLKIVTQSIGLGATLHRERVTRSLETILHFTLASWMGVMWMAKKQNLSLEDSTGAGLHPISLDRSRANGVRKGGEHHRKNLFARP